MPSARNPFGTLLIYSRSLMCNTSLRAPSKSSRPIRRPRCCVRVCPFASVCVRVSLRLWRRRTSGCSPAAPSIIGRRRRSEARSPDPIRVCETNRAAPSCENRPALSAHSAGTKMSSSRPSPTPAFPGSRAHRLRAARFSGSLFAHKARRQPAQTSSARIGAANKRNDAIISLNGNSLEPKRIERE